MSMITIHMMAANSTTSTASSRASTHRQQPWVRKHSSPLRLSLQESALEWRNLQRVPMRVKVLLGSQHSQTLE
jgi:hypothetical protein